MSRCSNVPIKVTSPSVQEPETSSIGNLRSNPTPKYVSLKAAHLILLIRLIKEVQWHDVFQKQYDQQ